MNVKKVPITAVLFDLDGTLLDTAADLGAALNHVLRHHNRTEVAYDDFRVESSNGSLGLLKLGFGGDLKHYDVDQLRTMFLHHYENNLTSHTTLFPGIAEYLSVLKAQNIPWGIVTNKPAYLTDKLVPCYPEFAHCKVCYSADTFKNKKPHPEPLLRAAEALNVSPDSTIYIGDAQRDMEAADRAGMRKVLAKYGYLTEQELAMEWSVDYVANTPQDLLLLQNAK